MTARLPTNVTLPAGADDRITCNQCRLMVAGRCEGWKELGAIKGYAPIRDIRIRCAVYLPRKVEPDQRTGAQRFRNLECVMDNPKERGEWKR